MRRYVEPFLGSFWVTGEVFIKKGPIMSVLGGSVGNNSDWDERFAEGWGKTGVHKNTHKPV